MARYRRNVLSLVTCVVVLSACGVGTETTQSPMVGSVDNLAAVRVRNFSLSKSINRSVGQATNAVQGTANQVGGAFATAFAEATNESNIQGRTAMSSVVSTAEHQWRNAQGQIIDAAGTLVSAIPLTWPASLGSVVERQIVDASRRQIEQGLSDLEAYSTRLLGLTTRDVEERMNAIFKPFRVTMPKIDVPGGVQGFVPATNPVYVRVRESQWLSSRSADVMIDVDFFGLKRYRIGLGCVGFPNGLGTAPRVALNGGCDNPWNVSVPAGIVATSARSLAGDASRLMTPLSDSITDLLVAASGGVDDPRQVPPLVVDVLMNRLLATCCMLSTDSPESTVSKRLDEGLQNKGTELAVISDPAVVKILEGLDGSAPRSLLRSMENKAAIAFGVPQLQNLNFSLPADVGFVAQVDAAWRTTGRVDLIAELGFFGLFVADVGLGCITFGSSWSQPSSMTFDGGCDRSWKVRFHQGGYRSALTRSDARFDNGADAEPPVRPTEVVQSVAKLTGPASKVSADSGTLPSESDPSLTTAAGGSVSDIIQNGVRYRVHVFTLDTPNEFVVPPAMERVPLQYLVIAGGGSGSSNRTGNKTGSGGGGAGGVVTNIRSAPLYLAAGTYNVIVGAGGSAPYNEGGGTNGGNSSINGAGIVAIGGGGGGRMDDGGRNGGSGGGAGYRRGARSPGQSVVGQGNSGGRGHNGCSGDQCSAGGGGGGAGDAGGDASKNTGGAGGSGVRYSFDGVQRWFAAGGGGGGNAGRPGGSGIGGDGGRQKTDGGDAAENTGSGGGGAGSGDNRRSRGGDGASGIVFIRYRVSR